MANEILSATFGAALGWVLGIFSGPLAHIVTIWILGPRLRVEFGPGEDCVTLTPEEYVVSGNSAMASSSSSSYPHSLYESRAALLPDLPPGSVGGVTLRRGKRLAFYARLCVTNDKRRIAQSCRAWLVDVEELNDEDCFVPTRFRDSVPLIWSYDAEADTVDIPQGIKRYVDLVRIQNDIPGFQPRMRSRSGEVLTILKYQPIFSKNGVYRLTVLVSAQEIKPQVIKVIITRSETWPPKAKLDSQPNQSGESTIRESATTSESRQME
jgi:hypothetical protein